MTNFILHEFIPFLMLAYVVSLTLPLIHTTLMGAFNKLMVSYKGLGYTMWVFSLTYWIVRGFDLIPGFN